MPVRFFFIGIHSAVVLKCPAILKFPEGREECGKDIASAS